ncbi:hypothetical protein AJ80_10012 [Polytolypa hystricis UAMH7299]|uniref:F-box domain-containing protein n=1 Tax=Polytolypa hystricis (strain UAMH7299) TaxID=1447883 RepID=A0A2B7WEY9_POLH7|nr:hypothetical protein AJ80_10012 [Polytolypa hystricis UAMH7299]
MSGYFSKLPVELRSEVADNLDTKALACLARVSTIFQPVAERRLYRTVDITSSKNAYCHALMLLETNRKHPNIGEYIKTLKISHLREESGKTQEPVRTVKQEAHLSAGAILEELLPCLSRLELLEVAADVLLVCGMKTQRPLAERLPSQLKHLHVEEHSAPVKDEDLLRQLLADYIKTKPTALELISVTSNAGYQRNYDMALEEICTRSGVKIMFECRYQPEPARDAWGYD